MINYKIVDKVVLYLIKEELVLSSIEDSLKKLKEKNIEKNKEHNDSIPPSLKDAIVNSEKFNEFIKNNEIKDMKTGKKANVKGFIIVNSILVVIVILTVLYFLNYEKERLIGEARIAQEQQANIPSNGRPYDPNNRTPINSDNTPKGTNNNVNNAVIADNNTEKEETIKKLPPFPHSGKLAEETLNVEKEKTPNDVATIRKDNKTLISPSTANDDIYNKKRNEKNTFHDFFGFQLTHPKMDNTTNNKNNKDVVNKDNIKNEIKKYTNQNNPLIAAQIAKENNKGVSNGNNLVTEPNNNKNMDSAEINKKIAEELEDKKKALSDSTIKSINEKFNLKDDNTNKPISINYGIKEFLYLTDQDNQFDKHSTLKLVLEKNKTYDKFSNKRLLSNSELTIYNKYIIYGNEAMERGAYDHAVEYFTKALEITKDDNLIGTAILMYLESKNPNFAFQTVVTNGLQNSRILTATIIDMVNSNYFLEASKVIEYAKTLDKSFNIYFAIGYYYNLQGKNNLALKYYNYSTELNPEFVIALYFKAKLLEKMDKKHRAEALDVYNQILNMKNIDKKIKNYAIARYKALNRN